MKLISLYNNIKLINKMLLNKKNILNLFKIKYKN